MKFAVATVTVRRRDTVLNSSYDVTAAEREWIGNVGEIKIDFSDSLRGSGRDLPIKGGWGHHPSQRGRERGGLAGRPAPAFPLPSFLPNFPLPLFKGVLEGCGGI